MAGGDKREDAKLLRYQRGEASCPMATLSALGTSSCIATCRRRVDRGAEALTVQAEVVTAAREFNKVVDGQANRIHHAARRGILCANGVDVNAFIDLAFLLRRDDIPEQLPLAAID
jgi:hypothetical protein